jgi:catechol 2,3-dioxygenase-like lactoylglutathione lyase family enzyme
MALQRMDHVGIVVEDLDATIAFFAALGMERVGRGSVDGPVVDRIVGLQDAASDFAMLEAPGGGRIELIRFASPAHHLDARPEPASVPGLRHLCFAVDDLDATLATLRAYGAELVGHVEQYGSSFRLCYVRGPAGIIVELAERLGA